MGKIKSFEINEGDKIGNYKISCVLGRGWEGEVYECKEISTGAIRTIKLFPANKGNEIGYVMHYAWFLEELSNIGLTPRYYHMGIELDHELYRFGFTYIIQELIELNSNIPVTEATPDAIICFRKKLKEVHDLGYGLGEWGEKNQFIDSTKQIRKIDFNPGEENKPNTDKNEDINWYNKTFKSSGITY